MALGLVASRSYAQSTRIKLGDERPAESASSTATQRYSMKEIKSSTSVFGQVRFEGMQYLTPLDESPNLTYSNLLSARMSLHRDGDYIDSAADVSAGTFFIRNQTHLVVHEAYASLKPYPVKGYAGRKKFAWSDMDSRWQMGLWQPRFAIDTLRPEEQGLTGFFANWQGEKIEILGFASPLYIPSMGPDIREEGGSLISDSRWYRAPSSQYNFNDRINSIVYDLDIPDAAKLVNQQSVGISGRYGDRELGPWLAISAGRKPVNDLILTRKAFKSTSEDKVDVTVAPEVTYHNITSMDFGYSLKRLKLTLSYLEDRPDEKRPEEDGSIQKLLPLKAYSVSMDFAINEFFNRNFAVQLGYLKVDGGGIQDIISDGTPDDFTLFDQRMKFTDALSVRVEGQLASIQRKPLVSRLKWLYDYDQQGTLLNAEFLFYPSQKWALIMGADILGVQDEGKDVSDFLNQYRANDRVYGGMTYVF